VTMSDLPPNIREFNVIVALIFNQLYEVFPVIVVCGWFAASRPCHGSLMKWVYRNELANNSSGVGYDYRLGRRSMRIRIRVSWKYLQV
jgi:hypothetical protein